MRLHEHKPRVYRATFTPAQPGPHDVHVTYNDVTVPASPFPCHVFDIGDVTIDWGAASDVSVGELLWVEAGVGQMPAGEFEAALTDPRGSSLPVNLEKRGGVLCLTAQPRDVGPHSVTLSYSDVQVPGSPHNVNVYDSSLARLGDVSAPTHIDQEVTFRGE